MKVITRTKDLRDRIADILSKDSGRRVAFVAFVGGDALRFVPEPDGLEVYCWPNKVATNPDGVRALLNGGAKVFFLDRLHMKAYWSSKGGYLIGSPNLSANALDETTSGLYEIGWYSEDSAEFDVDALIRRLHKAGAQPVDDVALAKLERDYNPLKPAKPKPPSKGTGFDAYLMAQVRKSFSHVSWRSTSGNTPAEIAAGRQYYEEATGRTPISNMINDSILVRHGTKAGTWILACKVRSNDTLGRLHWIYVHCVTKAKSTSIYSTALQLHGLHVPERPFDVFSDDFEARFGEYASAELSQEFDQRFNVAGFKRYESRRPSRLRQTRARRAKPL